MEFSGQFPGLTIESINNFSSLNETQKGHMRQQRQGVRSTKVAEESKAHHFKPMPGVKHKDVYLPLGCVVQFHNEPRR